MRIRQRFSVVTGVSLALTGCACQTEMVGVYSPVESPAASGESPAICCLHPKYPAAALWHDYCHGQLACGYGDTARMVSPLPPLATEYPQHGGPREPIPLVSPDISAGDTSAGSRLQPPQPGEPPVPAQPLLLGDPQSVAEPLEERPSAAERPPQAIHLEPPVERSLTEDAPAEESPAAEPGRAPMELDTPLDPPRNELPRNELRNSVQADAPPVTIDREPEERDATETDVAPQPLDAEEPSLEVPRNEIPVLRMKLKVSNQRVSWHSDSR